MKWLHLDASDENVFGSHCTKPDTLEASIVLETTTVSTVQSKRTAEDPPKECPGGCRSNGGNSMCGPGPTEVVGELSQHSSFRLTGLKTDLFLDAARFFFFLRFSQVFKSALKQGEKPNRNTEVWDKIQSTSELPWSAARVFMK